jgi:predicted GH43/DUF377 family glycosyl hydrolase
VPNVVYTCGAVRHGDRIILPYAVSDSFCTVSKVKISALLENLGLSQLAAPEQSSRALDVTASI